MRGFWGTDDQISILNPEAEFRIQFSMSKDIKGNEGGGLLTFAFLLAPALC